MNHKIPARSVRKQAPHPAALAGAAGLLLLAARPRLRAAEAVAETGPAAARSLVPPWDARGLGKLPWQGIACLDMSEDGRFLAGAGEGRLWSAGPAL